MVLISVPAVAQSAEHVACWVEQYHDPWSGIAQPITRCRLAGGEIIEYDDQREVPVVLRPNLGTDAVGPCWFLTSRATPYVVVTQFANGDALIGYIPDPNDPGNWIAVEVYRRCTSEPQEDSDAETRVWDYVHSYLHNPPLPDVNPQAGDGVTGLPTYLGTIVPPFHETVLTGGTATLEVQIEVVSVVVDWGDRTVIHYPSDPKMLAGYPSGAAWHIYQTKHDELALAVSYRWAVRWRISGGPWLNLVVPDSTTTVDYPVSEIVSILER